MDYHAHPVQIYYEDTDLSGVVYHANYLKYFERAREHLIGPTELARLYNEDGIGFVVYKCELTFKQGARLGDLLEIRTGLNKRALTEPSFTKKFGKRALINRMWWVRCIWSVWMATRIWCGCPSFNFFKVSGT